MPITNSWRAIPLAVVLVVAACGDEAVDTAAEGDDPSEIDEGTATTTPTPIEVNDPDEDPSDETPEADGPSSESESETETAEQGLVEAQLQWTATGPTTYHYEATVSIEHDGEASACGLGGQLLVDVQDGEITSARDSFGCQIDPSSSNRLPLTIEEWLTEISSRLDDRTVEVAELQFGSSGQPERVTLISDDPSVGFFELSLQLSEGIRPVPPAAAKLADELAEARARWAEAAIADYTMSVTRSCFCLPEHIGPFAVTVEDGVVTSVLYEGGPAIDDVPRDIFTVEGLLDEVARLLDSDEISVEFDSETGVPLSINADIELQMADEEVFITVTDFSPTG